MRRWRYTTTTIISSSAAAAASISWWDRAVLVERGTYVRFKLTRTCDHLEAELWIAAIAPAPFCKELAAITKWTTW